VTNLLDNAAKWSPPHGTVEVSLTTTVTSDGADSDSRPVSRAPRLAVSDTSASTSASLTDAASKSTGVAVVSVADHGPGIAPTDLPFIFDRFYRGRGARKLPGSGLGLAIVRRIVDSHAGQIRVEPVPGGGTRIVVQLPLHPAGTRRT